MALLTSIYIYLPHMLFGNHIKAILFFTLMLFLISKINKHFYLLVSYILIFFNIIFTHIYFRWGITEHEIATRIATFQVSPPYEIREYLMNSLTYTDGLIILYAAIGIYLVYRLFKYQHSLKKLRLFALVTFPVFLIFAIIYRNPFLYIAPLNYVYKYIEASSWTDIPKQRLEYLRTVDLNKSNDLMDYDKIVIIIGESASKNHMSLYGYDKKTTPFFDALQKERGFYKFHVISPGNKTRLALPMELTDANVNDFSRFTHSVSLVTDLKINGYKTYWLSNQSTSTRRESFITSIAHESDYCKIENKVAWKFVKNLDSVLLKELDRIKNRPLKEAYFLHLMGSHIKYTARVGTDKILYKNPKNVIQEYDNTIFYTDYILSEVYKKFKDEKLLFVYFSDHAEVVSEKECGHGYSPAYKDEYEIPFVIFSNVSNERLSELKKLNQEKIINLESMPYLIKYVVGIEHNISKVSTATHISVIQPGNGSKTTQYDYNKLKYFK